jgi:hypothetical protein
MPDRWLPGAERRPQNNGGSMAGGPARAVWHITWDALGKGGRMPDFDNIANYLRNVDFCPHLMWDPWTGRIVQFYPADQSARALENRAGGVETNRMGQVCLQVEVFFSPGAVVGGKTYNTVGETPCKGLDRIVAWMRSWGVPDAWPAGWPQWSGNSRSSSTWLTKAGHYGHCHVPENSHSDPGPMPKGMFEGDDMQLDDSVPVGKTYAGDFAHDSYPLSFVEIGAFAEAKRARVAAADIEKKVDAMAADLAEIKALLSAAKEES